MKLLLAAVVAAAVLGGVRASCPQGCSGQGLCSTATDDCRCYSGFTGADCSLRTCPQDFAWVDVALGDQNGDGVVGLSPSGTSFSDNAFGAGIPRLLNGATSTTHERLAHDHYGVRQNGASGIAPEEGHYYSECSSAGTCDRATGLCKCFEGYEGAACTRMSCPVGCSGHGTCELLTSQSSGSGYDLWDKDKSRICVCDSGFSGPDCSDRLCPKGDDPLYTNVTTTEVQNVYFKCNSGLIEGSFKLEFTDAFGFTWSTRNISVSGTDLTTPANLATNVQVALTSIPNDVITAVSVSVTETVNDEEYSVHVTFTNNPGDNSLLGFDKRGVTCNSASHGGHASDKFQTYQSSWGGKTNTECSRRGNCDYLTGLCACFQGYTGHDCSQQDALAM